MEHDDFYAAIFTNSSDAIISHDLDGAIIRWNLGAELLTGFTEQQMKGQPVNNLLSEENRKIYWRQVGRLVRSSSPQSLAAPASHPSNHLSLASGQGTVAAASHPLPAANHAGSSKRGQNNALHRPAREAQLNLGIGVVQLPFELHLLRSDQTLIPVSVTVSEIGGETKETAEICLIARDISRQKQAEDHIRELYATVSHELRTPLTTLQGALSVLDEGIVSLGTDDAREMVKVAREGADRLLKIVSDILDFRRLEANEAPLSLSVVRTDDLIDQSILAVKSLADKRNIELVKAVAQECFVSADKDRIIQVLVNLLTNAINYSPYGGKIQILAVLRRSGAVRLSVIDDGPGIPVELEKRIFQKFQRVDSLQTRTLKGTGLGLAMCKLIVDQHDGMIGFDSAVGKGSTFWVELKALGASSRQAGTVVAQAVKNCLIVSEDRDAVELLHKRLTKNGFGCRLVQTADVAGLTKSHKPHAILVDLAAVGPDVFGLIGDIRQVSDTVKIIIFRRSGQDGTFSQPSRIDSAVYGDMSMEERTRAILRLQKQELKCCLSQDEFLLEALQSLR